MTNKQVYISIIDVKGRKRKGVFKMLDKIEQNHISTLAQFIRNLLKDNTPNLENEFADMDKLPEIEFPYFEDDNNDHSKEVHNFQVLREYNDCLNECTNNQSLIDMWDYPIDKNVIYVNDNHFWDYWNAECQNDYITSILHALKPGSFNLNSCYIRNIPSEGFETFRDAVDFANTLADEAEQALSKMIPFILHLDDEERQSFPRTVHFLNTLEQLAGQTEQWIY